MSARRLGFGGAPVSASREERGRERSELRGSTRDDAAERVFARAGANITMIVALALCGSGPAHAPSVVPADEAPRGMVAFVDGNSCPPGWTPAAIAVGRLLVGTDQMTAVGRTVGEPLAAEEDRTHDHAMTGATLALPYKSISAADGGNNAGASSGAQPVTGTVAAAPSGLPFAQLTACVSP